MNYNIVLLGCNHTMIRLFGGISDFNHLITKTILIYYRIMRGFAKMINLDYLDNLAKACHTHQIQKLLE